MVELGHSEPALNMLLGHVGWWTVALYCVAPSSIWHIGEVGATLISLDLSEVQYIEVVQVAR